jgi:hypothetical protein
MGQYFKIANLDKKEYLCTWDVGSGAKFKEILFNNMARIVPYLLRKSDESGGGDIHNFEELQYCGRWACDRIVIIGDYDNSNLYEQINETNGWKSICKEAVREFNSIVDFEGCEI